MNEKLNFQQNPLRVGINVYPPFTIYHKSVKQYDGIEYYLLRLFEQYFNFTIQFHNYNGHYGNPIVNTTRWSGLIGGLIRNDIDMAIGGIAIEYEKNRVIDYLYPHCIDRFTFATTFPTIKWPQKNFVQYFLHPFDVTIWSILLLIIFIYFLWNLFERFLNVRNNSYGQLKSAETLLCFMVITIFRQSLNSKSFIFRQIRKQLNVFMIIQWLMSIMILTIFYSSLIQSELTIPVVDKIDTIRKLIRSCERRQITIYSSTQDFNYFKRWRGLKYCVQSMIEQRQKTIELLIQQQNQPFIDSSSKQMIGIFVGHEQAKFEQYIHGHYSFYVPEFRTESTIMPLLFSISTNKDFGKKYEQHFNQIIIHLISSGIIKQLSVKVSMNERRKLISKYYLVNQIIFSHKDDNDADDYHDINYDSIHNNDNQNNDDHQNDDNNNNKNNIFNPNLNVRKYIGTIRQLRNLFEFYLISIVVTILVFLFEVIQAYKFQIIVSR